MCYQVFLLAPHAEVKRDNFNIGVVLVLSRSAAMKQCFENTHSNEIRCSNLVWFQQFTLVRWRPRRSCRDRCHLHCFS